MRWSLGGVVLMIIGAVIGIIIATEIIGLYARLGA